MRARKSPLEAFRQVFVAVAIVAIAAGCEPARTHDVVIVDGATTTRFATKSAFAEYVELPGARNELRLTLANYAVSCDRWVPPANGDVALSITLVTPAGARPAPASYAWSGVPPRTEPLQEPYALPKALIGDKSRLFEPGGAVRLTAVALELHGAVTGALAFEYPGDGTRPATRIDGGFEARICRYAAAPTP